MSGLVTPSEYKNSNLGKKVSQDLLKSTEVVLMIFEIWDCDKPLFLKNIMTESALSGVLKLTYLEADRADSGDNPHEFVRYNTLNEWLEL